MKLNSFALQSIRLMQSSGKKKAARDTRMMCINNNLMASDNAQRVKSKGDLPNKIDSIIDAIRNTG